MRTNIVKHHRTITQKLKHDAVGKVDRKGPKVAQRPAEFMSAQTMVERIDKKQARGFFEISLLIFRKFTVHAIKARSFLDYQDHRRDFLELNEFALCPEKSRVELLKSPAKQAVLHIFSS